MNLQMGSEPKIFAGSPPNIHNANTNALPLLDTIKLQVHFGHARVALNFIACDTIATSSFNGANISNQHAKAVRPKQNHVEQNSSDCISILWKPLRRMKAKLFLTYGLTCLKKNPRLSPKVRVGRKSTLLAHSQTLVSLQSTWTGLAVQKPYKPLFEKVSSAAASGSVCFKPNIPFNILIVNMKSKDQKLTKNQKVATLMVHPTRIISTAVCAA